jgi:hypothetical protein
METIMQSDFRKDIEATLNRHSAENGSETPDFILAQYLIDCLGAYDKAVMGREKWYGRDLYGHAPGAIVRARKSAEPVPHAPDCQSLDASLPGPCDCDLPPPERPSPVGKPFFTSI